MVSVALGLELTKLFLSSVISNVNGEVSIIPMENAKTFVNGNLVSETTVLHRVRIVYTHTMDDKKHKAQHYKPDCELNYESLTFILFYISLWFLG